MPITKSAKKALRQNKKRRVHNLKYKKNLKVVIKEFRSLAETKKAFAMLSVAFNKGQQPVMNIAKLDKTNQKVAKAFGQTSQLPTLTFNNN